MPFVRHKKFGEREYAYEVTTYYDKQLKKPRQKVRYLGKVTEQGIQKIRSGSPPRCAVDYGDVAALVSLAQDIGLSKVLENCYGKELADAVLALAINRIVRGTSLRNFRIWFEGTFLQQLTPMSNPSSQNLSRILEMLGDDERSLLRFFQQWQEVNGVKSAVTYDITSLSSSSQLIELLEYGYNRDGDDLPQVNFGLVTSMETQLPLLFKIFPGSINDVSTLRNLLIEVQAYGVQQMLFILDRGFYSTANIRDLIHGGMGFVIPMPLHLKEAQRIISAGNLRITSPGKAVSFQGQILYVTQGELMVGEEKVRYFLYFDEQRRSKEINTFYSRLIEVETRLNGRQIHQWEQPDEVVEEVADRLTLYFSWRVVHGRLVVRRKIKAISRVVNRMGKTILLYRGDLDWGAVLSWYRGKDTVEKMFDAMKNDLAALPLRVQKDVTMKGSLVVTFVAMVLYFSLLRRMRESDLVKQYSVEGVLLELSKIKKIELLNGSVLTSEVSKKARVILQKLCLVDIVPIT
jgi:transposase